MIDILFDLTLGTAKVATAATIKVGSYVPVRVTFSSPPGTASAFSLALGTDATPPGLLAYTDVWAQESSTVWTATLDATDSRLVTYMASKGAATVNAEFAVTLEGVAQVAPNFAVTVQPKIVTGAPTSEGGPLYYSEAQVDALLAAKAAVATTLAGYGITNAAPQVTYVADGDSRTHGTAGAGGSVSWFDLLCSDPSLGVLGKNYGVSGKTVAQMVAGYSATGAPSLTVSAGHQWSPAVTARRGLYFVWGATNDLGGGASASTVLANLQTLYGNARADGYSKVVGFVETPRAPAPGAGWETTAETQRAALNAALRGLTLGQSNTPDVLIDLEQLFPRYAAFYDGTHPTAAQEKLIAQYVRQVLRGEAPSYLPTVQLRAQYSQTFTTDATQVVGMTPLLDNQALFDATAQNVLCPVAGWVQVSMVFLRTTTTVGDVMAMELWSTPPSGSPAIKWTLNRDIDAVAGVVVGVNVSCIVPVVSGERLDFRVGIAGTAGWTILTNAAQSQFTVRYVPAP